MQDNSENDRKKRMIDDVFTIDPVIAALSQEEVDKLFEERFGASHLNEHSDLYDTSHSHDGSAT